MLLPGSAESANSRNVSETSAKFRYRTSLSLEKAISDQNTTRERIGIHRKRREKFPDVARISLKS